MYEEYLQRVEETSRLQSATERDAPDESGAVSILAGAAYDHLGVTPIRSGDSVIIRMRLIPDRMNAR